MQQALFGLLDRMTNSITEIEVIDWELTDYADAFEQQKLRVEQRRTGECGDALIFTEHTPVYTMACAKTQNSTYFGQKPSVPVRASLSSNRTEGAT